MSLETVGWENAVWECRECGATNVIKEKTMIEHYKDKHPDVLQHD